MRRLRLFATLALLVALLAAPLSLAQESGSDGSATTDDTSSEGDTNVPDEVDVDITDERSDESDAQESVAAGVGIWTVLIVVVVAVLLIALLAVALSGRERAPPR